MSLSVLTSLDNSISANILKTKLESEDIPCFLNNENFTNLMPGYFNMLGSGVKILVPTDQLERAKSIANLEDDMLCCPNCRSLNISNEVKMKGKMMLLFSVVLLGAIPIGNLLNDYICCDCHERFKSRNPTP